MLYQTKFERLKTLFKKNSKVFVKPFPSLVNPLICSYSGLYLSAFLYPPPKLGLGENFLFSMHCFGFLVFMWRHQVLVVAHGIFRCSTWAQQWAHAQYVVGQHIGCQFPDQGLNSSALYWKAESYPLDHKGSPGRSNFIKMSQAYGVPQNSNGAFQTCQS